MISSSDAWHLRRLLTGTTAEGEPASVSEKLRRLAAHLAALPVETRQTAFDGFLCNHSDPAGFVKELAAVDPTGPCPESAPTELCATLADVAPIVSNQPWLWHGWLARGVLNVVASDPGTGKTRFAMDLARRLRFGLPWPDGQANDLPKGTRTMWVQADQAFPEMLQCSRDFGLSDDMVLLGSSPDDPTGSLDLDDTANLEVLIRRIQAYRPAIVVIDTVGMTTARNLCRPEEAREFFAPLMDLARETGTVVLLLTHLSKGGEALGRRIVEKARLVMKMTQPDPEGQPNRRRLAVYKSAATKPAPIGITMGTQGNEYDAHPPEEPDQSPKKPGPVPAKLKACITWLGDRLESTPSRVSVLRDEAETAGYASGTLYKAKDKLGVDEYDLDGRKWWKLLAPTEED